MFAGRAGFPAALKAAATDVGGPALAVPDDPPQPQSGRQVSRPLPSARTAAGVPADAFEIVAAAADSLGPPMTGGTGRSAAGASGGRASSVVGAAVPAGPDGGIAAARGDPRPAAPAERLAAAGPTVPIAANPGADPKDAGADPKNTRPLLLPLLAPIPRLPAPAEGEAGARKPSPAPVKGPPSIPAKGTSGTPPHAAPRHESATVPAPPSIQAAVLAGVQGVPAAGLPPARAAAADTAGPSIGNPTDRSSALLPAPVGEPGSRRPDETGARPHPGADPGIAATDMTRRAPPGYGTAPPPGVVTDSGVDARGGPAQPADSVDPAAGSPAAAPSARSPESAAARIGGEPSSSPSQTAAARIAGTPLPPEGIAPAPNRLPPRSQEPTGLFAGQVAAGTNPLPAANAGTAARAENSATSPGAPPPSLTEQISGPLVRAAANGHRDLALRLHPPELGEVSVRLVVTGREVAAWFDSPQLRVQQAISQSMGELHAELATAGYDLSGAWVGGEAWTRRERTGNPAAPRPVRPAAGSEPAPETRGSAAAAGAGVSVYV